MKLIGKNITKSTFKRIRFDNLFPFGKRTYVSTVIELLSVSIVSICVFVLLVSHVIWGNVVGFGPQIVLPSGICADVILLFYGSFGIMVDFQLRNDDRVIWTFVIATTIPIVFISQIIVLWVI